MRYFLHNLACHFLRNKEEHTHEQVSEESLNNLLTTRTQLRVVSILFVISLIFELIDPAVFIFSNETTIIARIAAVRGNANPVAWTMLALSMPMIPYMFMEVFWPVSRFRRMLTKLCCFSLLASSLQWFYLAWLANLYLVPIISLTYVRAGIGSMAFSVVLALALNSELRLMRLLGKWRL